MKQYENARGYGNIYTPHAGSMVIQVQREHGLANRTIVLSPRQVKILRFFTSRGGILVGAFILLSWAFFAIQAARVPILTTQLAHMERDAARLDTLGFALTQLQKRYSQVQTIMGAVSPRPLASSPSAAPTTAAAAVTAPTFDSSAKLPPAATTRPPQSKPDTASIESQ